MGCKKESRKSEAGTELGRIRPQTAMLGGCTSSGGRKGLIKY